MDTQFCFKHNVANTSVTENASHLISLEAQILYSLNLIFNCSLIFGSHWCGVCTNRFSLLQAPSKSQIVTLSREIKSGHTYEVSNLMTLSFLLSMRTQAASLHPLQYLDDENTVTNFCFSWTCSWKSSPFNLIVEIRIMHPWIPTGFIWMPEFY